MLTRDERDQDEAETKAETGAEAETERKRRQKQRREAETTRGRKLAEFRVMSVNRKREPDTPSARSFIGSAQQPSAHGDDRHAH